MNYRYSVNKTALDLILKKKKLIEGRLFKNTFKTIKVNDIICFFNNEIKKQIYIKVISLTNYSDFKDMLLHESIKRVTPTAKTLEEAINIYRKFYSVKDEKKYGVIAIELHLLKNNL